MCGAIHRGFGSALALPGLPSGTGGVPVGDGSPPDGGGGGGTVGLATGFRCVGPDSRNETIGLEKTTGDGVEGDGDVGLEKVPAASNGLPAE